MLFMDFADCHCEVDVSSQGKATIDRHVSTEKHKSNRRLKAAGTSFLRSFFRVATSPQDDKISAAELCKVYHAVKHHQSYRSVDCGVKVDREIFHLQLYLCISIISRSSEMLCFLALWQIICLCISFISRNVMFSGTLQDWFISVVSFWNRHHNVLNKYKYCEQTLFCLFCYT